MSGRFNRHLCVCDHWGTEGSVTNTPAQLLQHLPPSLSVSLLESLQECHMCYLQVRTGTDQWLRTCFTHMVRILAICHSQETGEVFFLVWFYAFWQNCIAWWDFHQNIFVCKCKVMKWQQIQFFVFGGKLAAKWAFYVCLKFVLTFFRH